MPQPTSLLTATPATYSYVPGCSVPPARGEEPPALVWSKMLPNDGLVWVRLYPPRFGCVVLNEPEKLKLSAWVIVKVTSVRLDAPPPKSTQPCGMVSVPFAVVSPWLCWVSDSAPLEEMVPLLVRLALDVLVPDPAEQLAEACAGSADWLKENGPLPSAPPGKNVFGSEKAALCVQSEAPPTSPFVLASTSPFTLSMVVVAANADPAVHVSIVANAVAATSVRAPCRTAMQATYRTVES